MIEVSEFSLYCALFWIQGKTYVPYHQTVATLYCALFWIQGKTIVLDRREGAILYCALFWIQGKTKRGKASVELYCTVPYFGFKAKQCSGACPAG